MGRNDVALRIVDRAPYCCQEIVLEKLEVHVTYGDGVSAQPGQIPCNVPRAVPV
ncbi:MAG: hypothetical protein KKI08_17585 [Armatimonadetes bacterium]|nr:hypothetical protein [Armatimonadota bacterium]